MTKRPKPFLLAILDGWGCREETEHNAIWHANTPNWDHLMETYPHRVISGSGGDVGLPEGQMGNSEVGHLNLGAGRIVEQDFTRITNAIESGEFANNPAITSGLTKLSSSNKALHILGLLSPGGVHSHEAHIHALIRLAAEHGLQHVYVHAFLDGRDMPPKSAEASIQRLESVFQECGVGAIASVIGRFYAMDRDNRWERVIEAYHLLTEAEAPYSSQSALEALDMAYARDETDEFVQATHIEGMPAIKDGDVVFNMNYRADRARQLTAAFSQETFTGFKRVERPKLADFIALTEYAEDLPVTVAYPPMVLKNVLGEIFANKGMKQLHIAETEKYAHVTFFFNGGVETPFEGEERILVPSPKVATYDLQPEMHAPQMTEKLVKAIQERQFDFIVCNFANPDMVGHSGNFDATVSAIEAVDECLGKIVQALIDVGGEAIITADHGNAERMLNPVTQQAHTAHTSEPVPLLYVGGRDITVNQEASGALCDVAPTILSLMGIEVPSEMTGTVLLHVA